MRTGAGSPRFGQASSANQAPAGAGEVVAALWGMSSMAENLAMTGRKCKSLWVRTCLNGARNAIRACKRFGRKAVKAS